MKEYSEQERLWIWLSLAFEGHPGSAHNLVAYMGSVEALYDAVRNKKLPKQIEEKYSTTVKKLTLCSSPDYISEFIGINASKGVYAVAIASPSYPESLKNIYEPPIVLYCRGKRLDEGIKLPFGIIGARSCTRYGEEISREFGKTLAANGMTIVSGLAQGCDAHASAGALEAETDRIPTVVILGQGINRRKTDGTRAIQEEIERRGIVISELLPDSSATRFSFPMRNRLISGLSEGLLIVEAGEKSGTMITANAAMEQGKSLFVIPGRITDRMSRGTNRLIKESAAQPVFSAYDILDFYSIKRRQIKSDTPEIRFTDKTMREVYNTLAEGELCIDELCQITGIPYQNLNLALTELEISGLIKQLPGRVYSVKQVRV